ncbi:MAG: 16S rRNA (cytidine(1402)-2'-O)-methyltransferase [Myxococcales bacterium]|nr:16S rRNA (cytidine(1402)-2'-O)-methyltransferase [Myxococcales bacterium]
MTSQAPAPEPSREPGAKTGSAGVLVVVATPIGNLEDLSPRAARHLRQADLIAAEDTRSVLTLLRHADAAGPPNPRRRVVSFFEGNEAWRSEALVGELAAGAHVVVVSEAGTPGVSDPGARAVRAAAAAGFRVEVVPGPCAAVSALVASGLPSERFLFVGFLPRESGARQALLGGLRGERATLIFYESPERVADTVADLVLAMGEARPACLSREITKVHEQHRRGSLAELAAQLAAEPPRGECTLVVAGCEEGAAEQAELDIEHELRLLLAQGLGPKDAAARLVVRTGKPRRQLYQLALSLRPPR